MMLRILSWVALNGACILAVSVVMKDIDSRFAFLTGSPWEWVGVSVEFVSGVAAMGACMVFAVASWSLCSRRAFVFRDSRGGRNAR
jgi:hypothetical protein